MPPGNINGIVKLGRLVNEGGKGLLLADGGTAAMDIAGEGQ